MEMQAEQELRSQGSGAVEVLRWYTVPYGTRLYVERCFSQSSSLCPYYTVLNSIIIIIITTITSPSTTQHLSSLPTAH